MKKFKPIALLALGLAAVVALAGCGGGSEKAAMVEACTESGESKENCTCIADDLKANLDADTFKVVAVAIATGGALDELPGDKQSAAMDTLVTASLNCVMASNEPGRKTRATPQANSAYDGRSPLVCSKNLDCNDHSQVMERIQIRWATYSNTTIYSDACLNSIQELSDLSEVWGLMEPSIQEDTVTGYMRPCDL